MKKAISLLLVLAVALSLSVVSFAATDNDVVYMPETNPNIAISPRLIREDTASPGVTNVTVAAKEMFIADTKAQIIVGTDSILKPGETYKFDVYYNDGGSLTGSDATVISNSKLLTRADIGNTGNVKFRTVKGSSSIQSTKVRTKGSGTTLSYYIEIVTRSIYGTKLNDVEYELSASIGGTNPAPALGAALTANGTTFQVGFPTIDDSETDVGEEGTIVIYNDAPVILKEQFADIAKSANYKNVTFEGEEGTWSFKGKVAGMRDTNLYYDFDPDTDILNKFPDQEFMFLTFRGGVNFPTTGEMRIDVSDVSSTFYNSYDTFNYSGTTGNPAIAPNRAFNHTMYAYLYRDGRLTEINGVYDNATDEIVFRTNYLGEFIITNNRITDTSLVPEPTPEEEEEYPIPAPQPNTNPNTGAASSANVMVGLGLLSLASAAVVSRKRK